MPCVPKIARNISRCASNFFPSPFFFLEKFLIENPSALLLCFELPLTSYSVFCQKKCYNSNTLRPIYMSIHSNVAPSKVYKPTKYIFYTFLTTAAMMDQRCVYVHFKVNWHRKISTKSRLFVFISPKRLCSRQKTTQSFELKLGLWIEYIVMIPFSEFQDISMSWFFSRAHWSCEKLQVLKFNFFLSQYFWQGCFAPLQSYIILTPPPINSIPLVDRL